ncbi:amidohydrolase family protein [Mycobacterium xenopi 3993]|nr:amidohydrolase family protein [Mycobacterium xenopi 3993]
MIKPAPVKGYRGWRSPALPEFDPFWRDVEDARLPIVVHASQPPLEEYVSKWEPPETNSAFEMSAFKWVVLGHREIADMLTSLICHGTLTRFPKLRIASVENGSSWIHPLFHDLQDIYKKMPQNFEEHPIDVFRRNIWVSPFWEGSVADVVETVGWDKVMFGSDYPHPEGLATLRDSSSTPKAWTVAAPTISWATTHGASWACPSAIPTPTLPSRQRCKPRAHNDISGVYVFRACRSGSMSTPLKPPSSCTRQAWRSALPNWRREPTGLHTSSGRPGWPKATPSR